ncbi:MAG: inositol monophosphatase [Sandaracinaceae bacterium]|nr:inositol monophosphatase [Sandaracinaceae bacterium]MDW8245401.1 inositol monophosphatase family protein [Sandaracinaceae bacterium]
MPLEKWLETAQRIAEEAGALLESAFRQDQELSVEHKGAIDLVTPFDRESEALIRRRLVEEGMAGKPGLPSMVLEEGSLGDRIESEWVWFCDPLDGTTNFAHRHFAFAVSIGLARMGETGYYEPVMGVVNAPAMGITWMGGVGMGAIRIQGGRSVPIRVSKVDRLEEALLATGFPYDIRVNPRNNIAEHATLLLKAQGVRRMGSAAIDLCLLAQGSHDGYWEHRLGPWDIVGGAAIAIAGGAKVSNHSGQPMNPLDGEILATNGRLHRAMIEALALARTKKIDWSLYFP